MVQFEPQDAIPPKIKLEGTQEQRYKALIAKAEPNVSAQWFRAIRILEAFSILDDELGVCAQKMLEVMDRE